MTLQNDMLYLLTLDCHSNAINSRHRILLSDTCRNHLAIITPTAYC